MTIYKPKPGDKKAEKKSDSSHSKIAIPEDVVWTWFCVVAFVEYFQLKWLPVLFELVVFFSAQVINIWLIYQWLLLFTLF